MLRLWDAHQELLWREFPADTASSAQTSFVSALNFSSVAGSTSFAAGFGDGVVRLYDARTPGANVMTFRVRKIDEYRVFIFLSSTSLWHLT